LGWIPEYRSNAARIYFRTGVYDDDPSNGGPNGFDWNVEHSTGVFIPAELGYQTYFDSARYPAKYDVGGYWSRRRRLVRRLLISNASAAVRQRGKPLRSGRMP
jgi:carbohydrate-selective porin OprB